MTSNRFACAALAFCALALFAGTASAQNYPAKAVRIVVPLSTGSTSDAVTRVVAQKLSETWGQQVVVENMPGANSIAGASVVARAAPDGYTLVTLATNHIINASLYSKLPFDAINDFTPIAQVGYTAFVLVVHPALPVRTVKEFISLAKARPGQLDFGSPGSGSPAHLCMELFKTMTATQLVHLPYKAVSQAQSDLIAGQIPTMFMVPVVAAPQARAGRLRALAVSSLTRIPALPDVPTLDESGIKGYEIVAWIGLFGPARVPGDIVNKIHADVARNVQLPDVQERMKNLGFEIAVKSPAELKDFLPKDKER